MTQVTLHTCWANPFCKSVEIALKFKGISFTPIEENLFKPSFEVRRKSPLCPYPPILVHNGQTISDASVILEYIDETWKNEKSLFPKDPKDRAKARSLIKFIELKCIPAVMRACWCRLCQNNTPNLSIQNAKSCLKSLENQLNGNKYFGGDSIGAVDISAVFVALWLEVNADANAIILLTNTEFPMLSKWISNILNNNIVKETLPQRDVLLSFHQKIHPQDFVRPRTKIIAQCEPKFEQSSHQNVEKLEGDYKGCYGIFKKFLTGRRMRKFVFPVDISK